MRKIVAAAVISAGLSAPAAGYAPETSLRPVPRPGPEKIVMSSANAGFDRWIGSFRSRALAAGIRPEVFDRAMRGLSYNTNVIERDRTQAEFTKTIWDYLDSAVSATRVKNGKAALADHRRLLERIERTYGVEKEIVVAVWGLESAYGTFRGTIPVIEALATLAYDGRRGRFFEGQLIDALKIVQAGDVDPREMTGSWAGAMGHTQFIPSSFLAYAVDFTGDGRRDIWAEDPTDALASTAAYLARFGWTKGQPWGMEVALPRGFDYALTGERIKKRGRAWNRLGVRDAAGRPVPDHGPASILVPAGSRGAAFMIFGNFGVIERYNAADAYVIAVGHLADRIAGGAPIRAGWPRGDRALLQAERKELQERLTRAGFSTGGIDGKIGPKTIAAVRAYQRAAGLVPDGYASLDILKRLR